jgi:hypothetical protein
MTRDLDGVIMVVLNFFSVNYHNSAACKSNLLKYVCFDVNVDLDEDFGDGCRNSEGVWLVIWKDMN